MKVFIGMPGEGFNAEFGNAAASLPRNAEFAWRMRHVVKCHFALQRLPGSWERLLTGTAVRRVRSGEFGVGNGVRCRMSDVGFPVSQFASFICQVMLYPCHYCGWIIGRRW